MAEWNQTPITDTTFLPPVEPEDAQTCLPCSCGNIPGYTGGYDKSDNPIFWLRCVVSDKDCPQRPYNFDDPKKSGEPGYYARGDTLPDAIHEWNIHAKKMAQKN